MATINKMIVPYSKKTLRDRSLNKDFSFSIQDLFIKFNRYIPQISRKNYRRVIIFFLIIITIYSLVDFLKTPQISREFQEVKSALIRNPDNPQFHLKLAELYEKTNNLDQAENEYFLALKNTKNPEEIKIMLSKLNQLKEQPGKIRQQINDWEKIRDKKSDYRDAYFQLAVLYWRIFNEEKSRENLSRVLQIDPNFTPALTLQALMVEGH